MTVINLLLAKKEEALKYWDTYKVAYKVTAPPTKLYEKFFDSKEISCLVPYGILPFEFTKLVSAELRKNCPKDDFDTEYAKNYIEFCMLSNDRHVIDTLNFKKLTNRPMALQTYLMILKNTKVSEGIKKKIMMQLVDNGYEGNITVVTDTSIIAFDLVRLHHRVNQWWGVVYKAIVRNLPFSDFYMPIKCSLMGSVVKKLDTAIPNLEMEDLNFAIALLVFNYIKRLKINVDIYEVAKSMSIEVDDIAKGLKKYDLKELYI